MPENKHKGVSAMVVGLPSGFRAAAILVLLLYTFSWFYRGDAFAMTPFREAQTAITSQAMARGESPFFAYHVPVLGKPWAVPMEFPLYQALVSMLSTENPQQMVWAGRAVSLLFGVLSLGVLSRLLRWSPLTGPQRKWTLLGVAAAPIYVGYGPAFLIETCALFFCLLYLWLGLEGLLRNRNGIPALFCIFAGVLGALVKPTTWVPFAGVYLLSAMVIIWNHAQGEDWKRVLPQTLWVGAGLGVPLLIALQWVHYGDAIKLENPLAAGLVSDNLSAWNYGSLAQKLSPRLWAIVLGKHGLMLWGPAFFGVLVVAVLAVWKAFKQKSWHWICWMLIPLAGYAAGPVIFTNLYFRHDYYLVANGVFACTLLGVAMSFLASVSRIPWQKTLFILTTLSILGASFGYVALRRSFREPAEEVLLERLASIEEAGAIAFLGFGWSSNMPYWLERSALMTDFNDPLSDKSLSIVETNRDLPFAAVVSASPANDPGAVAFMQEMNLSMPYQTEVWPGIRVWSRQALGGRKEGSEFLSDLHAKVDPKTAPGNNLLYVHSLIQPKTDGEGPLQVIFRRGGSLFVLDLSAPGFFRIKNYFQKKEPER